MSREISQGQEVIDDLHKTLREKIAQNIVARGWKAADVRKHCRIAEHDLQNLLTGKGNTPLARVIMLAADLGLKVEFIIS